MKHDENASTIKRAFISMFPVQALALGLPAVNSLLDSIIIGNFLGEQALAAVGFSGMLITLQCVISTIISSGAQLQCGKAMGKGDRAAIHSIFSCVLVLCSFFGLLFSVLCLFFSDKAALLLGATGEMTAVTASYIRGLGFGLLFSTFSSSLISFLQMEGMKKICSIATVVSLFVNLFGNLFSVIYLKWGLFGAGLFTSASNMISACIMLFCLLAKSRLFKFSLSSIHIRAAAKILYIGSPNAITTMCCLIAKRVLFHYIFALGGTVAVAATTVAINASAIISNTLESGYDSTCRAIAGMLVGSRDISSLKNLSKISIKAIAPLYYLVYGLVFFCAKPFALLLGADIDHISLYVAIIRIYNLWILLNLFDKPVASIYSALGKIHLLYIMPCICLALPVLLCILFGERLGLFFIVATYGIKEIFFQITYVVVFAMQSGRMPRSIFEICYISDSVSVPEEDRFETTICTVQDAVNASKNVIVFCESKGISGERSACAGLCIEEMSVDAINHRFDKHNSVIDLRVIYENAHISITLRDNCKRFSPEEWLSLCAPEDQLRSIGIRMVLKLASETNYMNTLGLNVLTLKL